MATRKRSISFKMPAKLTGATGSQYLEAEFSGFAGLNNKYSNVEIEDNEATDLLNVTFDERGAIQKRRGFKQVLHVSSQIQSIIPYYKSDGTKKLIITYGNNIIQYDPATNTQTTITNNLHGSGLRFSAAIDSPHDKIYMVNGDSTDGLMWWDGANFNKVSGAPNGKYLLYYKNHLYMAGDPNAPYRLYMSDQGDPTSWPVNNYIDFPDGMGGITGLRQLGDSIVVFKEHGVFILKGSDPSNYVVVTTFSGQHGAVSNTAITNIPNGIVYLSRDGVWLFDGKKFELLSDKIQGSVNNWNQQYLQNTVMFEYDHKVWLSVPEGVGQNTNSFTYCFSYLYGWWTKHSLAMQGAGVFNGNGVGPTPYFSDTFGNMHQADTTDSDNGAAIDAYFVTKAFDFGTSAHMKAFKGVLVTALAQTGNYNLNVTFIEDFGVQSKTVQMPLSYTQSSQWGSMVWGKDPWGGYSEVVHMTTNLPGQVRYLQFKIEQPDANAPFTFLSFTVRYKVKRRLA